MAENIIKGLPKYFEPICRLGEGGMGVVWSVRDTRVDKVGALKVIRRKEDMSEISVTRFEREIRNFAQLVHPYIVQVYDVGQMLTGEPYIFMEQVDGKPINSDMLKEKSFGEIMMLIDRILEGLDEAHANNLIHRDLKPDNILVTEDSEGRLMPKLMDFGLALRADENELRITSDGMVVGTPIYMAPEQACDEHYQICPATDFYGIGCILYELFCGHPPFTGSNAVMVMVAQAKETPKPFKPLPEFSETMRLSSIIMRLLEKMPDRRYETAADLRAAFRRQFLIRDNQAFGTMALKTHDSDTVFDERKDENAPFFSSDLAPKSYKTILPELEHCNYNYSVLSLRPPMFVGRSSAKYLLNRYLKDVFQSRRTALTMITGRPGVGKSRFLESFSHDCYKQGTATALVVDGSSCSSLKFAIYRALFGKLLLKTLTQQQIILALCRFLQTDDESDIRVLAMNELFQAEMMQIPPSEEKLSFVFNDIFIQLTHSRPLVLCFDNVSMEQRTELKQIACELTNMPQLRLPILMCVVNTTINDMPTDIELVLGNESSIWLRRSITIAPLSNSDMHALITQSLGICEELAKFIENMTSGLPQIAVSLARQWQLAGLLVPTSGGYASSQPIESLPIPKIVHEAILKQLYLTFTDYPLRSWMPVASLAAIYGDSFTPKNLSNAIKYLPIRQKVIGHSTFISLALSSGVLKTLDDTTLVFSNALMREALIATLQAFEIQDYHRAIAEALRSSKQSFENDCQIAVHLRDGSQFYEASLAYYNVAKQCMHCGELDKALKYIEETKEAIKQHFGFIDARTPEVVELWCLEARVYLEQKNYQMAAQYVKWLEYSCQETTQPALLANLFVLKARLAELDNNEKNVIGFLDNAKKYLDALPEPLTPDQLETKFHMLITRFSYDPSLGQVFIDTARALKNSLFVGKALLEIARHSIEKKDMVRAKRILNMTIDTAHRNGDFKTEASALYMLSQVQKDSPDVRYKTLMDALTGFEKVGDFEKLAQVHAEITEMLQSTMPDEAAIHAHWSELLRGTL